MGPGGAGAGERGTGEVLPGQYTMHILNPDPNRLGFLVGVGPSIIYPNPDPQPVG